MKQCFKCGETKPLAAYYAHPYMADGHLNKCKECTKKDVAENYRAKRPQYADCDRMRSNRPGRKIQQLESQRRMRAKWPEKYHARLILSNALRAGKINRQACEECGSIVDVEAHHADYSRPLDVRWLCFAHHRQLHGQQPVTSAPF